MVPVFANDLAFLGIALVAPVTLPACSCLGTSVAVTRFVRLCSSRSLLGFLLCTANVRAVVAHLLDSLKQQQQEQGQQQGREQRPAAARSVVWVAVPECDSL